MVLWGGKVFLAKKREVGCVSSWVLDYGLGGGDCKTNAVVDVRISLFRSICTLVVSNH